MRTAEAEERAVDRAGGFEDFFEREHARLFGTLCLVTADAGEAEDVMQEAFLRLWERWDQLDTHPDRPGYLYRTAFNLHRSRLRRAVRTARRAFAAPDAVDPFTEVDERQALFAALRRLPRRQRAAVVMVDLVGLSSEEAGRLLAVRPVTVRVLASQARQKLREAEGGEDA